MSTILKASVWFALLSLALGCSHKKIKVGADSKITKAGVISAWPGWVKDKKSRYDVQLNLANESGKGLIVMLGEIHCFRGTTEGTFRHTFFNTGERTIDLGPTEKKTFNALCDFQGNKPTGDYVIKIATVYSNPSNDGKTKGDIVARDIQVRVPESSK